MRTWMGVGLALVLAGCGLGNGNVVTETREVGSIRALEVTQGIQATVRLGEPASLTIETDENLLPLIVTRELNGQLQLGFVPNMWLDPTNGVKVTLVTPGLDAVGATSSASLRLEGANQAELRASATSGARVELIGMRVDRLLASCTSSAQLVAEGTADVLEASSTSSASLAAGDLEAREVRVSASSASRAAVRATGQVTGEVSSGASVAVYGQPSDKRVDTASGGVVHYEN